MLYNLNLKIVKFGPYTQKNKKANLAAKFFAKVNLKLII